jgi:hypothetical protein
LLAAISRIEFSIYAQNRLGTLIRGLCGDAAGSLYDQHGAARLGKNVLGHTSHQEPALSGSPLRTHHDQGTADFLGRFKDSLGGESPR